MINSEKKETHTLRDQALACYAALRQNKEEIIKDFLNQTAEHLRISNQNTLECAYWLWITGEYSNFCENKTFIDDHSELIMECIEKIRLFWKEPDRHWIWSQETGLFLSNIAIYYGALISINNKFRSETAQRICKEIREMTFSSFMKGTHFVSHEGSAEVWGDISTAAVPFGLVSTGNLALLSAMEQLDEDHLAAESAALMSWYHSECGQTSGAKHLLDQISSAQGTENAILINIAKEQLSLTDRKMTSNLTVSYEHEPVGGECPYIFMNNERSPRRVTVGDGVTIRTFAKPFDPHSTVFLEYKVDQKDQEKTLMSVGKSTDGEQYWYAELAPFTGLSHVSYRFTTVNKGSEHAASDWYSFHVLQWHNIHRVANVHEELENTSIIFDSPMSNARQLCLTLSSRNNSTIECSFSVIGIQINSEDLNKNVNGSYRVGNMEAHIQNASLQLHLLDHQGKRISSSHDQKEYPLFQTLLDQQGVIHKVRLHYKLNDEEQLYGMGERFSRMEYRGYELDNYVFNQYKDQGFKTYIPVPFVMSTTGYGLFLHSSLYSLFRFATIRDDLMQIEADIHQKKQSLSWYMFTGKPLDLIGQFTSITGKPKLPPKWSFGPWMSSNNWDSEKEVDWQLEQTTKYKIPSTIMVLEQWSDESTFYIWNDAQYTEKPGEERFTYDEFTFPDWGRWPNPKNMVKRVHDHGIKVLMWQAPVMKFMDGIAHVQRDEDEKVMIANHYGVRNHDGSPYRIPEYEWFRNSLVPDFTNPDAAKWWLGKRQYLFDEIGVDGFKTDGGECIYGSDLQFYDGRNGAEMRNEYPNSYIQAFYDFANEHVSGGAITFSRAGYTGAQSTPMHWAGDEKSTFEAFQSSMVAGLSCGMSGIPFWGWDLGGFSGEIPTAELYIRSTQMAAFCPVMQYHAESKGEFNLDRTPWNIAERTGKPEVLSLYKKYADIRMNLLPYIYEQARISSETGYPLMRAMLIAFPDDSYCRELTLQYMFGDSLLVAPVTEEGATEVDVYLPKGNWTPLFGRQVLSGERAVKVAAKLEEIPVFIKEDSVIPLNLGEACQLGEDVGNATDRYESLCLMICLSEHINYCFSDELGNTVQLSAWKDDQGIEATTEVSGEYPTTLLFRALGQVSKVTINGKDCVHKGKIDDLEEDDYFQRNDDLLLRVQPGKHLIKVI